MSCCCGNQGFDIGFFGDVGNDEIPRATIHGYVFHFLIDRGRRGREGIKSYSESILIRRRRGEYMCFLRHDRTMLLLIRVVGRLFFLVQPNSGPRHMRSTVTVKRQENVIQDAR